MSRRCKPGQRCRVIRSGANRGKIVMVVRAYFGEKIGGSSWPKALYPWVVSSLGGPLRCFFLDTRGEAPPQMTIVMDDSDLEPLSDDDDGLDRSTEEDKPIAKPKVAKRVALGMVTKGVIHG